MVSRMKVVDSPKAEVRQSIKGKQQKAKKLYLVAFASTLFILGTSGSVFSVVEYQVYSAKYHKDMSLAQTAMQHLKTAETLLGAWRNNPLETQSFHHVKC